jgi:hypothetical protein
VTDSSFDLFKELLGAGLPALGPGPRTGRESIAALESKLSTLFKQTTLTSTNQSLVRSLILLWHDHLDESHSISQEIHNPDGSLLHGMMHRREPDYWNSKYWFNRVGQHRSFAVIGKRVARFLDESNALDLQRLLVPHVWDPHSFVDECERVAQTADANQTQLLQRIQEIEFNCVLEEFCR